MKFAAICAIAGSLLLAGCSTEDNSALNINDVTTTTTIVGSVEAFRTQVAGDPLIETEVSVSVAGQTVFVGVPNSNFGTGSGVGYQWFTTTVVSVGPGRYQFSITVPVVGSANVSVYASAFTGTSQVLRVDGATQSVVTNDVLQRTNRATVAVQAGNSHVHSIAYTRQVIN